MLELTTFVFNIHTFFITAVLALIYIYLKTVVYSYWKTHNIPHDEPTILIGTLHKELLMQKITLGTSCAMSYEKFKSHPLHGLYIFLNPSLMINDPDLIKDVLIKNFQNFCDRGLYSNEKIDPLTGNLFFLSGDKWKTLRTKFSSIFTPSKLKNVFSLIEEIAEEVINVCDESLKNSDILDIKDILTRYTIDTIFSLAFGFNSKTTRNPESIFRYYGNLAIESRPLINTLSFNAPDLLTFLRIPIFNKKASSFFINLFQDMINKRKIEEEKRNDFLNLIVDMLENEQVIEEENYNDSVIANNIKEKASRKLDLMEATAQAFLFFVAGFETSSSTATFCLYELALHPDIQENLHKEIDEFLQSSNVLNIESLMKLEYLDMVFNETLRKHPIVPLLNRICVKDYKFPNSNYCVPKGMRLIISVNGIHNNPEFYPDPHKFDPTRFSKENKVNRHPSHYLPFGIGPRYCIGQRLGILQTKMILFFLLSNYQFSVCEKTSKPIQYSKKTFLQSPDGAVYLKLQKRKH